jgi:hypothetical protein
VRLEGLGQFKNAAISSGIEPATFRLVACSIPKYDKVELRMTVKESKFGEMLTIISQFEFLSSSRRLSQSLKDPRL